MEAGKPVSAVDAFFVACQIDAATARIRSVAWQVHPEELTLGRNLD